MDAQLPEWTQALAQGLDEIAVQFDDVERADGAQQAPGDGALAGADLHQPFSRLGADRHLDTLDDRGIMEKVLAEAFTGIMFHPARVLESAFRRFRE